MGNHAKKHFITWLHCFVLAVPQSLVILRNSHTWGPVHSFRSSSLHRDMISLIDLWVSEWGVSYVTFYATKQVKHCQAYYRIVNEVHLCHHHTPSPHTHQFHHCPPPPLALPPHPAFHHCCWTNHIHDVDIINYSMLNHQQCFPDSLQNKISAELDHVGSQTFAEIEHRNVISFCGTKSHTNLSTFKGSLTM